jgi:hypothetical protein
MWPGYPGRKPERGLIVVPSSSRQHCEKADIRLCLDIQQQKASLVLAHVAIAATSFFLL